MFNGNYTHALNKSLKRGDKKEIAKEAKCSIPLVSLVLKGERTNKRVIEETENRILDCGIDHMSFRKYVLITREIFNQRGEGKRAFKKHISNLITR